MTDRIMRNQPKRWTPGETIAAGFAVLVLGGGAAVWRGSVDPWQYGAVVFGVLLVLAAAWDGVRGRKG